MSKLYESTWFAYLLLALNVFELGIWPVMLGFVGSSTDLLSYMIMVFALGTGASFIALLLTGDLFNMRKLLVNRRTLVYLSLAGLLNYGLASLFMTYGTIFLKPDVSILMNRSWVLLMVPFIPILLKEKIKKGQLISLVVGFAALYFALTDGTIIRINYSQLPYMLIVLFGALSTAISSLMIKAASVKLSVELFLFNSVSLVFFLLASLILKLLFGLDIVFALSPGLLASSLFVGLVTYFFGAYAYFYALNKLRISVVGTSLLSVPFITFAFSYALLGENLKGYFIVTALILVLALVMQARSSRGLAEVRNSLKCARMYNIRSQLVDKGYDESYRYVNGANSALLLISEIKEGVDIKGEGCMLFDLEHIPPWMNADHLKKMISKTGVKEGEKAVVCIGDIKCINENLKKLVVCK